MGLIVTILCGVGVLASFLNPIWASCYFVFVQVFRPNEHVEGVKFPVLPVMIVTMAVVYFIHMNRKLPRPKASSQRTLGLMALMVVLLVAHLLLWHRELLMDWILGEAAPLLLFALFATRFMSSPERLHSMFSSVGVGSAIIGGQALGVHFLAKQPLTMFKDQFGDMLVSHGKLWDLYHLYHDRESPERYSVRLQGRGTGTWGNSNDLAMVCNWGVPAAIYYLRRKGSMLLKAVGAGVMLMLMATIFLTGSRGNQVQLGINLWMIFVGGRRKALGIVLLVIAVIGALVILPRLQPERADAGASSGEREKLLLEAGRMFIHNPVKGVGFMNFQDQAFKTLMPHNVYAQCLAETGLVGAMIFFPLIFFLRRDAARSVKYFESGGSFNNAMLARCVGSMQFAFLVFMLFTNQFMRFTFGLVMACAMALYVAMMRDREKAGAAAGEATGAPPPDEAAVEAVGRPVVPQDYRLERRQPLELQPHRGGGARYVFDPDAPDHGVRPVDDEEPDDFDDIDDDPYRRRR